MGINKKPMVSRSMRLRPETLSVLENEASHMGIGITVHIRGILENYVSTRELMDSLVERERVLQEVLEMSVSE